MKKIMTIVCLFMLGVGIGNAQVHQGQSAAGLTLSYGSEIESLGIGARYQYGILDQLRGEVSLNYFFEHDHLTWWDVNLNAHYLLGLWNEQLYFYPLAGLNYTMVNDKKPSERYPDGPGQKNYIGLNIGCGFEYELNEHFGTNAEYRHTINGGGKYNQGVFTLGLNYKF